MPFFPEFCNASCSIRMIKVLREPETEHFAKSYGHKRVTRKVKVKLKGISSYPKPCKESRDIFKARLLTGAPYITKAVGKDNFRSKSQHKSPESVIDIYRMHLPSFQSLFNP